MAEPTLTEATLALHIQEGRATDPVITTALVKQFAPSVQRFTVFLLNGRSDTPDTARALTRQTFATALNDPDSFAGKENIRAWLYAQALRQTRALPDSHQARQHPAQAGGTSPGLESLPQQEALPLLLRYSPRLSLPDIAQLLRTSENKIHKHLSSARQKLILPPFAFIPPASAFSHHPRETQRLLDGLLDPEAEAAFRDHLDTCSDCRAHLKQFTELEFHLNSLLFHDPQLPEEQIQDIIHAVANREIPSPQRTWQVPTFLTHLPVREMMWVIGAAAIFFVLARWLNPFFSSPPPGATPTPEMTPTLPPAQNLSTVFRQSDPVANAVANVFPGLHVIWALTDIRTGDYIPTTPMTFSPTGFTAAFGIENRIILWDFANANSQVALAGHEFVITALDFSQDEESLASGDEDGNVFIWKGNIRFRLEDHPGPIRSLAYSPNGRYLAVGLNDGIWLWEIKEDSVIRIQKIQWEWIRGLAFSPDSNWLAAADRQDTIAIWSIPQARLLLRYETLPPPRPSGQANPVETRLDIITRLAFSPDGKKLASGSFNGTVEIVSLSTTSEGKIQGTRLYTLPHSSWISEVRWSLDGTLLATVSDTSQDGDADSASRAVFLWDAENGVLAQAPLTARIARGLSRAIFSPLGNELWVSNFDGSLFRWKIEDVSHLVAAVPNPQFFARAENNLLAGPLPEDTLSLQFTDPALAAFSFPPYTLSPLPAQYTLVNGRNSVKDEIVILNYQTTRGNTVTISERGLLDNEIPSVGRMIGASGVVQPVQINGTMGEYVVGSWVITHPDNPDSEADNPLYRWQAAGEARLRWQLGRLLMEIRTPLFQYDQNNLTMNDLIRLAENLTAQTESPILLGYTVQDGDTCIGIAQQYGTSPDRIAQANEVTNCDLIVIGQILLVPLPTVRETVAEVDLNCDGRLERIRAIPDPNLTDLSANFGVVVETIPLGGDRFWPMWQMTIADVPVFFFGLPNIIIWHECDIFLAVSLFGGTGEFSGLDVYRWDGEQMSLVLDANGYAQEIYVGGPGGTRNPSIITQSLVPDFAQGGCIRTITTYEWDGTRFTQLEEIREEGVDCFEG